MTAFATYGSAGIRAPSDARLTHLGHRKHELSLGELRREDDGRLAPQVLDHHRAVALDLSLGVELDGPAEGDAIGRRDVRLPNRLCERLRIRAVCPLEGVGRDQDGVEG